MSTVALAGPGTFLGSSIGKKVVMAVTGLMLFGFVLGHMAGNLQVYLPHPEEAMRSYALFLHGFLHGAGIWVARLGLLAAAVLHIWAATALTIQNKEARPVGYRQWVGWESTYASRTMRWSGVILLSFIIFHLLHLTTGQVHPQFEDMNPYRNLVTGFQQLPVSIFYILSMVLLGMHLAHGIWSMLQTLGLSHPRYKKLAQKAAVALASLVVLGNISFPIAVLAGILK